jgi:SAM-dependent methyltransferase
MPSRSSPTKTLHPLPVHPFDRRHQTDTGGLLPGPVIQRGTTAELAHLTAYYGIAPSILQGVLDAWLLHARPPLAIDRYTFLDVGAGKGRALLLAAHHPFLGVEGVELNPALAAIAQQNLDVVRADASAQLLTSITLHNADATVHPLPETPLLAFLFHPFERPVMRRFLRHVESSLAHHPRPADLIYVNAEHGRFLDAHPTLQLMWEGNVAMSAEDHAADLAEIAQQAEYGSTGDEFCKIYRFRS